MEYPYKDYVIEPAPEQLVSGMWTLKLYIWLHKGAYSENKPFSTNNTFKTKEKAVEHCIIFGKQIIDGEVDVSF